MKFEATLTALAAFILGVTIGGCQCKIIQFIFGDSLIDVGNNVYLTKSLAQPSLPWYGVDFGDGLPNGRFTNGRTVADIIGDSDGLPRPPAFMDPSLTEDVVLENGVNFASSGGGILNETGAHFIQRFSLYKQIELYMGIQKLIVNRIGQHEAQTFFQQAKYVVALGSNDFINNYLMPVYSASWKFTDESFVGYLMETLERQLKLLHNLGARRLMVFGLGPLGCIPLQRVMSSSGACQERTNELAISFNKAASQLSDKLSGQLPNASLRFGDAYDFVNDMITNPQKYGFSNSNWPCCSLGNIRPALTCTPVSTLCNDRSKYVFWDEYHPTEQANELIANELIKKFGFLTANTTDAPSPAPAVAPSPLGLFF